MHGIRFLLHVSLPLLLFSSDAPASADWTFSVGLDAAHGQLHVRACSADAHREVVFQAKPSAAAFLLRASRSGDGNLQRAGSQLAVRRWEAGECLQYSVDLIKAASSRHAGIGSDGDHAFLLDAGHWLWRPRQTGVDIVVRFELPDGWSVSVPWLPVEGAPHEFHLGATPARWPAQTAFGRFDELALALAGGRLRISVLPIGDVEAETRIRNWLLQDAALLMQAYARMPVPDAQLLAVPLPDRRAAVPWGQVTRGGGAALQLFVGAEASADVLHADWTLAHELAHLLHPPLPERDRWLGEGLASYYQNLLRARGGAMSATDAWKRLLAGLQRGERATSAPAPALETAAAGRARGSTMRVYWAGAAFWLESDLQLRAQGTSLDGVLERYSRLHLPAQRQHPGAEFAAALDAIDPRGGFLPRYSRYRDATRFPPVRGHLQALLDEADPRLDDIMMRRHWRD